jgi:hypothetical protein
MSWFPRTIVCRYDLARITNPKKLDASYLSMTDPLDLGFESEGFTSPHSSHISPN